MEISGSGRNLLGKDKVFKEKYPGWAHFGQPIMKFMNEFERDVDSWLYRCELLTEAQQEQITESVTGIAPINE